MVLVPGATMPQDQRSVQTKVEWQWVKQTSKAV